jgi:hypothetical protein
VQLIISSFNQNAIWIIPEIGNHRLQNHWVRGRTDWICKGLRKSSDLSLNCRVHKVESNVRMCINVSDKTVAHFKVLVWKDCRKSTTFRMACGVAAVTYYNILFIQLPRTAQKWHEPSNSHDSWSPVEPASVYRWDYWITLKASNYL